jgi:hypothetical protein
MGRLVRRSRLWRQNASVNKGIFKARSERLYSIDKSAHGWRLPCEIGAAVLIQKA